MPGKKLTSKQMKIARVAEPRNKITGADFRKLKMSKKKNGKKKMVLRLMVYVVREHIEEFLLLDKVK